MSDHEHVHHGPSYISIYISLLVLTGATVLAFRMDLGNAGGLIVAAAIASLKGTLVGLYFMHLNVEVKPIYILVGIPLVLTLILVVFLMPDVAFA